MGRVAYTYNGEDIYTNQIEQMVHYQMFILYCINHETDPTHLAYFKERKRQIDSYEISELDTF